VSEQGKENTTLPQSVDNPPDKPAAVATEKKKPTVSSKRKKQKSHNVSRVTTFLIVALLLAGGIFLYDYINKFQRQLKQLASQQIQLQQQNAGLKEEFASKWGILKQQQDDLNNHLAKLLEKNQHLRKDWLVLEAEYLIQIANHRLLLERDINTAVVALESADARLRDTGDPGVLRVRQIISEAMQELKQVPQSDLAGLSLSLSTLYKGIEKLPLATPDPKTREQQEKRETAESRQVKNWQELPAAIWRDLKNLIVIRNHEEPVQALLSPEQRFFLLENLRLQLEQARLALLTGQEQVYKERIATAIQWIKQHFDKESAMTSATIETLQQLSSAEISPELPDISSTYQALQKYRRGEKIPATENKPEQKQAK